MGKSSGSPPQSPDPRVVIPLQTEANMQMFDRALNASRYTTSGPTGSQSWSQSPSGEWTQTNTLSPEQQQLYNQTTQAQLGQAGLMNQVVGQAGQAMSQPLNFGQAPALTGSVSPGQMGAATLSSDYLQAPTLQSTQQQTALQSSQAVPTLQANQSQVALQANQAPTNLQSTQTQANLQATPLQEINQRMLAPGQMSQGVNDALQGFSSQIGALDPMQFNQQAADALYNQGTRYLDPALQQQQSGMEARLAEQGFVPGTPAYNQAMTNFMDTSNRARADARDRAVTAGVASGQANFGNRLGALQSQIATALQGGNFQNAQQAQDFSQQQAMAGQDRQIGLDRNAVISANDANANAVQQQLFQNQGVMDQARNQALQQNFQNQGTVDQARNQIAQQGFQNQGVIDQARNATAQQTFQNQGTVDQIRNQIAQQLFQNQGIIDQSRNQVSQQGFQNANLIGDTRNQILQQNQTNQNAARQQNFQNAVTAGQFGNQARNQSIAEILQQRNQPLNELAALRGGTQVQMPQGNSQSGVPNLQAPDIMGAYNNQYMGQLGAYNAQVGQQNSMMNMLGQLGLAGAMYFSDRRLKSNIRPVGRTSKGFNLYSYTIFGRDEVGVMADEVREVLPSAVQEIGGFLAVDYSQVL